ncbi:MAG: hypothetical protein K0R82_2009 [Flavipsychrobacter sp.]|jgi:hypothetical protein|nr:hypothetical protein [Flavipsychrobacter sp.]
MLTMKTIPMKTLFLSIMLLYATAAGAQGKVWLPELFVHHAMAGDDLLSQYLKPFEFIVDPPDSGLICLSGGQGPKKLSVRRLWHDGHEKLLLPPLDFLLDPDANPREYVERFAMADVYLSRYGKKLLLEIVESGKTERIEFIDRLNGEVFTDGFEAITELRMHSAQGKVWLPEPFVQHAVAGDTALDKYLRPFVYVLEPLGSGVLLAYKASDPRITPTSRVVHNGQEKIQLLKPSVLFPIDDENQAYVDRLEKAQLYLSKQAGEVVLEIVEGDNIERIEYTDRVYGKIFTDESLNTLLRNVWKYKN